jgi:hypothetical protein
MTCRVSNSGSGSQSQVLEAIGTSLVFITRGRDPYRFKSRAFQLCFARQRQFDDKATAVERERAIMA